ncbi:lipoteichoic acid stability factor AuxA [Staphylococcus coagulans]|uniref:lipoteichoic acid stability factor AuxA n=1 Tax=Staphylococcus coagulans TaxID=74706 RepID=UPI0030EF075F
MSLFNKYTEVIYSYIIGALSILLSVIIFINIPLIHELKDGKHHISKIDNLWDFIMAFFNEIIRVMSKYIGDIPLASGIIILLFGILMLFIGRTLTNTTRFDYDISILFLLIGIIFFVLTLIFMSQVYGWIAFVFIIPFLIHIGYIAYKDELNPLHRKEHYLWIIFSYGICYIITQLALYTRIESRQIAPIDVLSINTFFVVLWLIGQMAIWNFLFLRRSLPVSQEEITGEENPYSRSKKYQFANTSKIHFKDFQDRTVEFTHDISHRTRRSIDIERLRAKRETIVEKWFKWARLEEDDIPTFLKKRPKWLNKGYVTIACGVILLFFILLEFNNRNALFLSGDWELSQTQYVYEWISLFLLLIVAILFILTSVTRMLRGKYYYLQLFMISILFFKLLTEYIVIVVHGLLLSIFITPILILMLVPTIIAFVLQLRQPGPVPRKPNN